MRVKIQVGDNGSVYVESGSETIGMSAFSSSAAVIAKAIGVGEEWSGESEHLADSEAREAIAALFQ